MSIPIRLNIISPLNALFTALCLAVAASLSSCQKDLTYMVADETYVGVAFDLGSAPALQSVETCLFPMSGEGLSYHLPTVKTSRVEAPGSKLRAFCYNADSYINRFSVSTWERSTVTTGSTYIISRSDFGAAYANAPRGGDADEPVLYQPTALYADTCSLFDASSKDAVLTFRPRDVLSTVHIEISGIKGIERVKVASAALSGMAAGMSLSTLTPVSDACTIPVSLDLTGNGVSGTALCFGHCSDGIHSHFLTVYMMLTNGTKVYFTFDVGESLHSGGSSQSMEIKLRDIEIPETTPEGGFSPDIDTWHNIEETIFT